MNFRTGDFGKYERFIADTERRYGLPCNLLALTLWQASGFDPEKITGARQHPTIGVCGIASMTLDDCKVLWNGVDRRTSPHDAIIGCARLLARQHRAFNSWRLALLAYHSSAKSLIESIQGGPTLPIDAHRYTGQAEAHCRL